AHDALRAAYRDGLGLGPATSLTERLLALFELPDALSLMHAFTRRDGALGMTGLGRITPLLLDEADAGDAVARALVERSGGWLGEQARVSAGRVGLDLADTPVVFSGGVLTTTPPSWSTRPCGASPAPSLCGPQPHRWSA